MDQQKQLFGLSISQALKRTDRDLQTMGYDPNQLSDRKLNLLADYTYNVGSITKFPKFVKALVENDFGKKRSEIIKILNSIPSSSDDPYVSSLKTFDGALPDSVNPADIIFFKE